MLEMFTDWLKWLFGVDTSTPSQPNGQSTIGNHNSIPETAHPNHKHQPVIVQHLNAKVAPLAATRSISALLADQEPVVYPTIQSLVQMPLGGVLTKADIINGVIQVEAGYVNNPNDKGGETNLGITAVLANEHKKTLVNEFKWDGKMKSLTKPMAVRIYEKEFWDFLNLDEIYKISPFLADKLFDIGVNVGKTRGAKWFQRALNAFNRMQKDYADIGDDGQIGKMTLTALNGFIKARGKDAAVKNLLKALICQQGAHYLDISLSREANETFTFGWFNRLDHHVDLYMDK